MYHLTKFNNEDELRAAIDRYIHFYNYERFQERFGTRTPMEVRTAALATRKPVQFPIAENKRILQYKAKFAA
jgi:transposase InsO family protein